jgi:hypothetical protein
MSSSRPRALGRGLLCACCSALVLVSAAGANDGNNLILGHQNNTASSVTAVTTVAGTGFKITDTAFAATALWGESTAATGAGWGVYGSSSSVGPNAVGVYGVLSNSSPQSGSTFTTPAAVRGISYSQTENGMGVYGLHNTDNGTAPGVAGETSSTATDAVGVLGVVLPTTAGGGSVAVRGINNGSGHGIGVWGTGAGKGVWGSSPKGTALIGESSSGTALQVNGKAKFSRSGLVTIPAGMASNTITLSGVTTSSMVIATAQQSASVHVKAAVPAAGSFTIYLTGNAPSGGLKVAYFVLN